MSYEEPCGNTAGYLNVRSSSLSYSLTDPVVSNGECVRYPFQIIDGKWSTVLYATVAKVCR